MLMPPNSTRSRLTFGSSGLVGVYRGRSVTSCPRAISSTASALSREQLPQYIPAAPAVTDKILISPCTQHKGHRGHKGTHAAISPQRLGDSEKNTAQLQTL